MAVVLDVSVVGLCGFCRLALIVGFVCIFSIFKFITFDSCWMVSFSGFDF